MLSRDRVFMENKSLEELMKQEQLSQYHGHWNITILVPQQLTALEAASSVYTIATWLEIYADSKLHNLIVAPSPDDVWSIALEERIEEDAYEI